MKTLFMPFGFDSTTADPASGSVATAAAAVLTKLRRDVLFINLWLINKDWMPGMLHKSRDAAKGKAVEQDFAKCQDTVSKFCKKVALQSQARILPNKKKPYLALNLC